MSLPLHKNLHKHKLVSFDRCEPLLLSCDTLGGHVTNIHACMSMTNYFCWYTWLHLSKLSNIFPRFFECTGHELQFEQYSLLKRLPHWFCVVLGLGEKCDRSLEHIFHKKH